MLTVEQKLTNRIIAGYLKNKGDGDYLTLFPKFILLHFKSGTSVTSDLDNADQLAEAVAIQIERYGK